MNFVKEFYDHYDEDGRLLRKSRKPEYLLTMEYIEKYLFDGAKILGESEQVDYEILHSYIRDILGGTIGEEYADPYGQGRIVAVTEAGDGSEPEPAADPDAAANLPELPEGVVPVTWEPSE